MDDGRTRARHAPAVVSHGWGGVRIYIKKRQPRRQDGGERRTLGDVETRRNGACRVQSPRAPEPAGLQSIRHSSAFNQRGGGPGFGGSRLPTRTPAAMTAEGPIFCPAAIPTTHGEHGAAGVDDEESRSATYDGGVAARTVFQPGGEFSTPNNNGGMSRIQTRCGGKPRSPSFGPLLRRLPADGGSGGDPSNHAQKPGVGVRQDPADRSAWAPTGRETASTAFPAVETRFVKRARRGSARSTGGYGITQSAAAFPLGMPMNGPGVRSPISARNIRRKKFSRGGTGGGRQPRMGNKWGGQLT